MFYHLAAVEVVVVVAAVEDVEVEANQLKSNGEFWINLLHYLFIIDDTESLKYFVFFL